MAIALRHCAIGFVYVYPHLLCHSISARSTIARELLALALLKKSHRSRLTNSYGRLNSLIVNNDLAVALLFCALAFEVAVEGCSSVVRAPAAEVGGPGLDSRQISSLLAGLLNVDGMKDLWCSSTVRLLSAHI